MITYLYVEEVQVGDGLLRVFGVHEVSVQHHPYHLDFALHDPCDFPVHHDQILPGHFSFGLDHPDLWADNLHFFGSHYHSLFAVDGSHDEDHNLADYLYFFHYSHSFYYPLVHNDHLTSQGSPYWNFYYNVSVVGYFGNHHRSYCP